MGSKKKNFARFGVATKGVVYILIGVLTALAAFGLGGQKANSSNALDFIADQSFGKVLLGLVAVGLLGYVFWRWRQVFFGDYHTSNGWKKIIKKISYFISGLFYSFLAVTAVLKISGSSATSSSNILKLLDSTYAAILAIVVGLAMLGKSVYEFYQAYSGKFIKDVDESEIPEKSKPHVINAAKVGLSARGIVSLTMAYLLFKAVYQGAIGGVDKVDVFDFVQDEFGTIILGIIAVGLIVYGAFMLIKSKYSDLNIN